MTNGWTLTRTSIVPKIVSGMAASFQWQHWHQKFISGLRESGGILHLFGASASPYRRLVVITTTKPGKWQLKSLDHSTIRWMDCRRLHSVQWLQSVIQCRDIRLWRNIAIQKQTTIRALKSCVCVCLWGRSFTVYWVQQSKMTRCVVCL